MSTTSADAPPLVKYHTPIPEVAPAFFAALARAKLATGLAETVHAARGRWGATARGKLSLAVAGDDLDAFALGADVRGLAVAVNARAELDDVAAGAAGALLDAAAAAVAAGEPDAPAFVILAWCDLKALTTAYVVAFPALLCEGADGVTRDVAGARFLLAGEPATPGSVGSPRVRFADALASSARAPPAPLGWPARAALAAIALRSAAAGGDDVPLLVAAALERPPAAPQTVAISLQPPPHAAAAALLDADAPWRGVLAAARAGGLGAVAAFAPRGRPVLPPGLAAAPAGALRHAAPPHATSESDAAALAATAANLNLELMRWSAMPELDVARLEATRVLLIGAGALGCAVARGLLAWGIHRITFIDSGRVALSNAPRQSLFVAADAAAGAWKAEAAAAAVQGIRPGAATAGIVLSVPTPGRAAADCEVRRRDVARLRAALGAADAVCLLVDTREARWLPAVLCAAEFPALPVVSVGMGFGDALIVRHGSGGAEPRLACYFCAGGDDSAGVGDSTRGAAMDALCTVARGATAPVAGALAADLIVALRQHPLGAGAPHEGPTAGAPPTSTTRRPLSPTAAAAGSQSLGALAHVTRVSLRGPPAIITAGVRASARCLACGDAVRAALAAGGDEWVASALADARVLAELQERGAAPPAPPTAAAAPADAAWALL